MLPIRSAVGGSTIAQKIPTSRSDDENERCRGSGPSRTLQKFAAAHASIYNHFNHDRHLNRRDIFKQNRSAAGEPDVVMACPFFPAQLDDLAEPPSWPGSAVLAC